MKKIILSLMLTSYLFGYSDSDMDGVEDVMISVPIHLLVI